VHWVRGSNKVHVPAHCSRFIFIHPLVRVGVMHMGRGQVFPSRFDRPPSITTGPRSVDEDNILSFNHQFEYSSTVFELMGHVFFLCSTST